MGVSLMAALSSWTIFGGRTKARRERAGRQSRVAGIGAETVKALRRTHVADSPAASCERSAEAGTAVVALAPTPCPGAGAFCAFCDFCFAAALSAAQSDT